jgi:cobalt-zinc-cadmium efflux system outer membrane protein
LKLDHRSLLCLALVLALGSGCTIAPPDRGFADGVVAAGVSEPIQFVGTVMPADANEDAVKTLTIADAVRRALKNDPAVQAAIAEVRAALADARQTRLIPNPVLSVAVRLPEGGGKPVIEAGLAADLVSLLLRPRQISAADHRLRAASSDALTVVLDALADVQEQYANAQALDARIGVLDQRKKLVQRLRDLARARLEAGESSRLDLITFDTERVSLDVEITQAASERREQRLMLARLIGQPSGVIEWELMPWTAPTPVALNETQWVRAALEHRPEVQSRRWELAALGDEVALAKLAVFDGADVGVEAERDRDWSIGPAIFTPLPLFDWGQQRRAKAEAQRAAARHRLTQTRRQIIEEVRRAVESLTASQAVLRQVQTQLIPLADEGVQQAEAAYKNGLADVTAVLLAEQEAQSARLKLIELQQSVSSASYRLHRAVGGPGIAAAVPATQSTGPTTTTRTASQSTEHP